MFFEWRNRNKKIKELRKNMGYTAQELAIRLKVDTIDILKIDELRLRDVAEPLRSKIMPVIRGDDLDRIPW